METSKRLSASVTSSQRTRKLKIATLHREELERQNVGKLHLKQQKKSNRTEKIGRKKNRVKLADATVTENAILEDMKEKSSSIDLPDESRAGSKRTKAG